MGVCLLNTEVAKKDCKNRCRMKSADLKFHFFKMHFLFVFSKCIFSSFFQIFIFFFSFATAQHQQADDLGRLWWDRAHAEGVNCV